MALWKVEPTYKKSCIERQYYNKDDKTICWEIGWRWGEFFIEVEGDETPVLEAGVDIFNCDYELSDWSSDDGCWEDYDYTNMTDEEIEEIQNFLDEGNSGFDLEGLGWIPTDGEMIIDCDVSVERVSDGQ